MHTQVKKGLIEDCKQCIIIRFRVLFKQVALASPLKPKPNDEISNWINQFKRWEIQFVYI